MLLHSKMMAKKEATVLVARTQLKLHSQAVEFLEEFFVQITKHALNAMYAMLLQPCLKILYVILL